ncbi:MAG: 1-acyl-sn-glycerol-3-phosphate acyltransferase [Lachnospiraceae bacterium]|nr:1-acyl-sn-glycerol-3-phosphate acyltransferase [Lachnospiraceae bacterium]
MLRFYWVIFVNLFRSPHIMGKMKKMTEQVQRYTDLERYQYAQYIVRLLKKTGAIQTEVFGMENIPAEGGYMMYPNHQGKFDAFGIIDTHRQPCTLVMDKAKSYTIFIREALDLLHGKRLDKDDIRQAFSVIQEVTEEVKNGARYILFPEGKYGKENKNVLGEFKPGCFKIALKSKAPILPVALIDSYKVFNSCHLGPVTTQVHYLKPILYEEYRGMRTQELAAMVRERIQEKIDEVTKG